MYRKLKLVSYIIPLRILLVLSFLLVIGACGKKKAPPPQSRRAKKIKKVKKEEAKKIEKYVYKGHKNRNPFFVSGGGGGRSRIVEVQDGDDDPSGFILSGIMTDLTGSKYALMSDGNGGSYILKNGWLYDVEGKRVPSITGTVFEDRVIIISGTTMKELKLPGQEGSQQEGSLRLE